ncbi:hypothetical protein ES703_114515 [subsurface metagenome]
MKYATTDGISSPYIFTQSTSMTELGHNLSSTAGDFVVEVQPISEEKDLRNLLESELIFVQVPPEYDEKAFYLLSNSCQFQSLPSGLYGIRRSDLRFLYEAGIPYTEIN